MAALTGKKILAEGVGSLIGTEDGQSNNH